MCFFYFHIYIFYEPQEPLRYLCVLDCNFSQQFLYKQKSISINCGISVRFGNWYSSKEILKMIYTMLQTISVAVYTAVSTAWLVEGKIPCRKRVWENIGCNVLWPTETVIRLMLSCSLMALRLACHPLIVMPMIFGAYYVIRKIWVRRPVMSVDITDSKRSGISRTPRLSASYRSIGSSSSRSVESFELEVSDEVDEVRRRS